jgi:hypothetical protein
LLNLYVRHIGTTLGSGDVHFSFWLRPERTRRQPHISGIRIIIVNEAANDHSAVGDIVNMRWRRETVHKLNEKACRTSAVAIAPKSGAVKVIACIEDPVVIDKILAPLEKRAALAEPVVLAQSRAPPQRNLFD